MIAVKKLILPFVCPAFLYSDAGIITRPGIQPRGGGIKEERAAFIQSKHLKIYEKIIRIDIYRYVIFHNNRCRCSICSILSR